MGKTVGATVGGNIIANGRKRIFIFFNILAIISQVLMQILDLRTIVIGKFLNGLFVTSVHIAYIKMINETAPVYLLGICGTVVGFMQNFGYMTVQSLGVMLPQADYDPEIIGDERNDAAL